MVENRDLLPPGVISTIVVPVPWLLALSLKLLISRLPWWSLPIVVGRSTIPYGLTSPFAGTVDATVETALSGAMNAVAVVAAGTLAEVELDALLLLLEPPHPDSARMASGTAKMIFLLTGFVLSFDEPRAQRARSVDPEQRPAPRPLVAMTPKPPRSFPADETAHNCGTRRRYSSRLVRCRRRQKITHFAGKKSQYTFSSRGRPWATRRPGAAAVLADGDVSRRGAASSKVIPDDADFTERTGGMLPVGTLAGVGWGRGAGLTARALRCAGGGRAACPSRRRRRSRAGARSSCRTAAAGRRRAPAVPG